MQLGISAAKIQRIEIRWQRSVVQWTEPNDFSALFSQHIQIVFVIKRERVIGRDTDSHLSARLRIPDAGRFPLIRLQTALQFKQAIEIQILLR